MKIAVLGSGNWGFSIAYLLCNNGHEVLMWGRNHEKIQCLKCNGRYPNFEKKFHRNLKFTSDIDDALYQVDLIVEAVTIGGLREVATMLYRSKLNSPLIVTSKGIESKNSLFPTQIIEDVFKHNRNFDLAILSGPTLSSEIIQDKPGSAVLACKNVELAKSFAKLFQSAKFKLFIHSDILGVQLGGAFKNIFALGCGILDGLNFGDNAKAFLLTRGLEEMRLLAIVLKCVPLSLFGLSGLGDLIATCISPNSRNYIFGRHLGKCGVFETALFKTDSTIEGINTAAEIVKLAKQKSIDLPVAFSIQRFIKGNLKNEDFWQMISRGNLDFEWK